MKSLTDSLDEKNKSPIIRKRKVICINGDYLGSIKQMPFLIKAIQKISPKTKIMIRCEPNYQEILKKDLCFEGISQHNIITKTKSKIDIYSDMEVSDCFIKGNDKLLDFWIDPLKFEKRRLLNESEIKDLREKYKIREDEQVVLGGSLNQYEMSMIWDISWNILKKNPKIKFIFVPRGQFYLGDFQETEFETDSNITGGKKRLMIEEKGCLDKLYSICDSAIIGNTFKNYNTGQNPLEPAFYGKRTLYGNHDNNWNKKAYNGLRESKLLVKVNNDLGLMNAILNPPAKKDLEISRQKAQEFITSKQGAATEYAKLIKDIIDEKIKPGYLDGKRNSDILPFWNN
ncbi:MAG: hypothetical protein Q7S33_02820 [Nanoarchaeota archaeon]|nr:hypothetical protein [Nanoarchaeota archaeon]